MNNFYHVMIDTISLLLLFPEDVLAKSVVVLSGVPRYVQDLLNDTIHFCVIESGRYIYAANAYHISPMDITFPLAIARLHELCVKRFALGQSPPTRYCLFNRPQTRRLSNLKVVLKAFRQALPEYPWEIAAFVTSISRAAALFDSLRVFLAPQGAGTTNIIFMQRGTLLIDIESNLLGLCYLNMTRVLGIYCVFSRLPIMDHHSTISTAVPAEFISGLIRAAAQQLSLMDKRNVAVRSPDVISHIP
jgi:hypothetical protein